MGDAAATAAAGRQVVIRRGSSRAGRASWDSRQGYAAYAGRMVMVMRRMGIAEEEEDLSEVERVVRGGLEDGWYVCGWIMCMASFQKGEWG